MFLNLIMQEYSEEEEGQLRQEEVFAMWQGALVKQKDEKELSVLAVSPALLYRITVFTGVQGETQWSCFMAVTPQNVSIGERQPTLPQ